MSRESIQWVGPVAGRDTDEVTFTYSNENNVSGSVLFTLKNDANDDILKTKTKSVHSEDENETISFTISRSSNAKKKRSM